MRRAWPPLPRLTRPRRLEAAGERLLPSRLDGRDLVSEAFASLLARPARAALTVLGTVLGIAALVATLGIAETAGGQIVARFDEVTATAVVVTTAEQDPDAGVPGRATRLPFDAEDRVRRLTGVRAVGTRSPVDVGDALVSAVPVTDPLGQTAFSIDVVAGSPGLLDAVRGRVATGRWFDSGHAARADRVAVLGPGASQRLQINRIDQQPAVFIGDDLFVVIGILDDVQRQPSLLNAVIIPEGTAVARYQLAAPAEVNIDTAVGAAQLIARQAPVALAPNSPEGLQVLAPADPASLRGAVQSDVDALFLVLGGIALLVGAIGIANVTLVGVLERVGEIGLRRALGAARTHIAWQFLLESGVLGLVGGVMGSSVGVLVVVGTAAARTWTPALDAWLPLAAPLLGAAVGILAGVYPALRAAALEPVEALRS